MVYVPLPETVDPIGTLVSRMYDRWGGRVEVRVFQVSGSAATGKVSHRAIYITPEQADFQRMMGTGSWQEPPSEYRLR